MLSKRRVSVKGSAQKRGLKFDLTLEEFSKLVTDKCFYCGIEPDRLVHTHRKHLENCSLKIHGIDRVDNDKGYTPDNCVTACSICNQAKHTLSIQAWNEWLKRIINFQQLKKIPKSKHDSFLEL